LWLAGLAPGCDDTGNDPGDADTDGDADVDADDDADADGEYPWFEGSFQVEVLTSWVQMGTPFAVRITALDTDGEVLSDYNGRVYFADATAVPVEPWEPFETAVIEYREDGVRVYPDEPGAGGFVDGVLTTGALFPVNFCTVPEMEVTFAVVDEQNEAMRGTTTIHVINVGMAGTESFTFPSMDHEGLVVGEPFSTTMQALDPAGSPDLLRRTVHLFTLEGATVSPGVIEDFAAVADSEATLTMDLTVHDPGIHRVVLTWQSYDGLWLLFVSPERYFAAPSRTYDWQDVTALGTDASVNDLWANGEGDLYVGTSAGEVLHSADGGDSFVLMQDFAQDVIGVGENFSDPDSVCILMESYDVLCWDGMAGAFADCGAACVTPPPGHLYAFGPCSGATQRMTCLQGRPNKWVRCCHDTTHRTTVRHDVSPLPGGCAFEIGHAVGSPDWHFSGGDEETLPFGFARPRAIAFDTDAEEIFVGGFGMIYTDFACEHYGRASSPPATDVVAMQYDPHAEVLWVGAGFDGLWAVRGE